MKGDWANFTGNLNVNVMLGNPDGTFQPPKIAAPLWVTAKPFVADLNGDGKADLISPYPNTGLQVALGNGRTAALVEPGSRLVWWCFPRFDSDPIFSRLLAFTTSMW